MRFGKGAIAIVAGASLAAVFLVPALKAHIEERTRQQIYAEMESMLGVVPTMFKHVPDESLELEWELLKQVQMMPGAIPNKYRELIGVAVAGITHCRYCAYYHTQFAKLNGATDEEIEDALHVAKSSAGWSTYINGLQLDYDQFCREVDQMCEHVRTERARAGGK